MRPYMSFLTIKEWRSFIYPLMVFAWVAIVLGFVIGLVIGWRVPR